VLAEVRGTAAYTIVTLHHPPMERFRPRDAGRYHLVDQYGTLCTCVWACNDARFVCMCMCVPASSVL
jgi:hypothetical protein